MTSPSSIKLIPATGLYLPGSLGTACHLHECGEVREHLSSDQTYQVPQGPSCPSLQREDERFPGVGIGFAPFNSLPRLWTQGSSHSHAFPGERPLTDQNRGHQETPTPIAGLPELRAGGRNTSQRHDVAREWAHGL